MHSRIAVAGMTCEHCVSAVTSELSSVAGVEDVEVSSLVPGGISTVEVTSSGPLQRSELAEAVAEAGYDVVLDAGDTDGPDGPAVADVSARSTGKEIS